MDYSTFDAADFLLDPDFVLWVKEGKNDAFWQTFRTENPAREEALQQARMTILAARTLPVVPLSPKRRMAIWENVQQEISTAPGPYRRSTWQWAAAAVVLLAGWMGWQLTKTENPAVVTYEKLVTIAETEQSGLVEQVNTTGKVLPVRLPDGSSVLLQQHSRVSYSESSFEGSKREVYLSGEAFFEVAKNPGKPFFVYANELVTRVLGTSFTVRAYPDDKQVDVFVKTGKVSVFTRTTLRNDQGPDNQGGEGTVLTPNQQVTLQREGLRLSRTLIRQPEILVPGDQAVSAFEFDDELVSLIFGKLQKAYGVEIVYDEELLAPCKITASLTNEPLYEKIRLICQGLGAAYEVIDARIVIHSSGCN